MHLQTRVKKILWFYRQDIKVLSMEILDIPKVELHRHLELSIRHSTLRELAPRFGIEIPDDKTFADRFLITEPMADLKSVLDKFLDTQLLLADEEILERITYEACEDAFNEGIFICELRYSPTFVMNRHDNLSFTKIHEAILKGIKRAEKDLPMAVGLICTIQRTLPVKEAEKVTQFAIDNKETFIGLDLADNEKGFDSKPFAPFFVKAKKAGLRISVHCGELRSPKAPRYIKDAIDYLGAERVGHGVQIYRDQEIMDFVREKEVTLELCLTSNWLTNAVDSIQDHPFRTIMKAGIRTTINTDDPGIFNIDMNHEYKLLRDLHGFTLEEFKKCNEIAKEASFISEDKKNKVWPIAQ